MWMPASFLIVRLRRTTALSTYSATDWSSATTQVSNNRKSPERNPGNLGKKRLAAFDTHEELAKFVGGKPVLNKPRLIVETRNDIVKARMIFDTTESGVKWITAKTQRVILPRLLDAVLWMLFLHSLISSAMEEAVSAFVLDFSDAFWQIPIHDDER